MAFEDFFGGKTFGDPSQDGHIVTSPLDLYTTSGGKGGVFDRAQSDRERDAK
jgi:hypothetical protein